jgi:hypothetical protein
MCAEGWAMWAPGGSPDLPKATGGTRQLGKPQGRTSWLGLLLGRLGFVCGTLSVSRPHADGALGNSEGEIRCGPRRSWLSPGEPRAHAGLTAADPVTRELFCPETRAVGLPGAR